MVELPGCMAILGAGGGRPRSRTAGWQGVLTSEFFLDNKRFVGKIPLKPDPKLRAAFSGRLRQNCAKTLALR
jgi:hypothetical protein